MSEKEGEQKRQHFRIVYPFEARPTATVSGKKHPVLEVSESGLKLSWASTDLPGKNETLTIKVSFQDGETITVKGKPIRMDESAIAFKLSEGFPLQKIMAEQRFLIKKYKNLNS